MGRHTAPAPRSAPGPAPGPGGPGPAELVGWGLFTLALAVGALLWWGAPLPVVAGVGATVLAGTGAVALAMTLAPRRPPPDPARGQAPEDDDDPRVP